ncbi:dihydrodipicolinate synthase [Rahnella aquatilis CIP 78.65 = ATCC 33071]|uniref:Dihydrodipicolinate synthase/N-acetylneuraminate lyase n=1 Tax=Rahnella aquatilis (strain ATCC 33071 / DSM 4594 / JCM 1683 / NBRC 105701 / NCIMB 13365 / CIP 78.65) TaxID=745277 RepID=H2J270_RAHAC|nr:dihydrodipicolinate synthase family protein [Rahnella aquatilis]AEX54667.1 dihydrodipicolinate synthase/N-acetylneuraminate lyase [Rahnella aquatilis CIP 78.65 = ATCC 33071]KFD00113.1 dihydrodipicolinate synthase [Rahnella aquatilis CIP 78.65 = ATCC 33071]
MFTGLSAFPLTPLTEKGIDEKSFVRLMERLVAAGVDSIGALGSTGSYAYLKHSERDRVARLAVEHAGGIPVMVSIGSVRTSDVLHLAEDAQRAGVSAVLLAPVSYQKLTSDEVFTLYETVTRHLSVPLCVYDNPGTTNFDFTDELYVRIAQLPHVASIKIPGLSADPVTTRNRLDELRLLVPSHVTLGAAGDLAAATVLTQGGDVWYSVIAGLFPEIPLAITRAAQNGDAQTALALSARLEPLWALFRQHGSLRVVAAAAEILGIVSAPCLPLPLQSLSGDARQHLISVLETLFQN